jgi:hypothetical protein
MVEREADVLLSVTILNVPQPLAQYTENFVEASTAGKISHRPRRRHDDCADGRVLRGLPSPLS